MTSQYYITDLGSDTEETAEVKRYLVWPLDSGPQNGIVNIKEMVESGDDLDYLVRKYKVEPDRIFKMGQYLQYPHAS